MRSFSCLLFFFATSYLATSVAADLYFETAKEAKGAKAQSAPTPAAASKPVKQKKLAKQPLAPPPAPAPAPKSPDRTEDDNKTYSELVKAVALSAASTVGSKLNQESPGCFACAGENQAPKACGEAYADLYSKPTLNFHIALGYTDQASDWVHAEDVPRRTAWVQRLSRPCRENMFSCGFKRDPDDMDLFTKDVAGPDGRLHAVRLRLTASSVGVDDKANRTTRLAEQTSSTNRAEANFFDGLNSGDVVIYAGHARKGGGPDFAPPYLHKDGLHTDESKYANRASEKRMLKALADNTNPPKLIGLFACDAGHWFSQDVRDATKNKSGVASSNGPHLTEPEVVFAQAYAMLDSILALRCDDQFQNSLNAFKDAIGQHGDGARLHGFFGDEHPLFSPIHSSEFEEDAFVIEKFKSRSPLTQDLPVKPNESDGPSQSTYDSNHEKADGVR